MAVAVQVAGRIPPPASEICPASLKTGGFGNFTPRTIARVIFGKGETIPDLK